MNRTCLIALCWSVLALLHGADSGGVTLQAETNRPDTSLFTPGETVRITLRAEGMGRSIGTSVNRNPPDSSRAAGSKTMSPTRSSLHVAPSAPSQVVSPAGHGRSCHSFRMR